MALWIWSRYLLLLVVLVSRWQSGESVRCFVCSWSPKENQTNYCSQDKFQANMVGRLECDMGCEFVTQFDKNGEVTSYFRNCANLRADSEHQCQKTVQKSVSTIVCTCNTYLCNKASHGRSSVPLWTILLLAVTTLVWHRNPLSHVF